MYLCEVAIVSQLCIFFHYVLHGLCEDYLTCDIAFNAVMPLSRALTHGRYSRIEGVTPSLVLSLRLSASTAKGLVTGSGTTPSIWWIRKDGKVNKGIFDIHVIDVYFTSVHSNPSVFGTSSVAMISNSKWELQNKQRLVKGEVTMCVGNSSKIDMIIIAHSLYFRD